MAFLSPLRYPGGKGDLANFFKLIYLENDLSGAPYVEIYAGGAGVAMALLLSGYSSHVYINDLDQSLFAFWHSVLNETEELCRLILDTPVTMEEWGLQRDIQGRANQVTLLELGFSTFFLNRTNRSGIIRGGVIGGRNQAGNYRLDARFNRQNLVNRIQRVARYRERVSIYNQDAADFIQNTLPALPANALVYLDPPYYVKGQGLYKNYYSHEDHENIARLVATINQHWIVSYDNAAEILGMYQEYRHIFYNLSYSAAVQYQGAEAIFFSDGLTIPRVNSPAHVHERVLNRSISRRD